MVEVNSINIPESCKYAVGTGKFLDIIYQSILMIKNMESYDNKELIEELDKKLTIIKKLAEKFKRDFFIDDFNENMDEDKLFDFIDMHWDLGFKLKNERSEFEKENYSELLKRLGMFLYDLMIMVCFLVENYYSSLVVPVDYNKNIFSDNKLESILEDTLIFFERRVKPAV